MINVGFDDQIFVAQDKGGISKYFVELITRLPKYGINPIILSDRTSNIHLAESGFVPKVEAVSGLPKLLRRIAWKYLGTPNTSVNGGYNLDVMHHTFTQRNYLKRWKGKRVVTVFDMIPELFPSYFPYGNPHLDKKMYCHKSNKLIAISNSTANDLVSVYGPEMMEKTKVIPFGVGEEFFSKPESSMDLPNDYILFVGVRSGYKDFSSAFRAFRLLAKSSPELHLVLVGGGPLTAAEKRDFNASGLTPRIRTVSPRDSQMPEVYSRAKIFVFPSRYEGFGLPTLESLASKTVTVLADASCSREVGGFAALYFEPGNIEDLVQTLAKGLTPESQDRVRVLGPKQGLGFSWEQVAERTAQVYKDVFTGESK